MRATETVPMPADERFARVGDVELCYQTFGDPERPTLLLIMGLGTQMIAWHVDFCRMLVDRGFHVVRYDNRDVGRSSRLDSIPPPTRRELLLRRPRHVGYTLDDLADDAAGLLDHLGVRAAHVAGASMGGMIAQVLAVRHPERVLSLASIMSTTGARWVGQPAPRVLPTFLQRPANGREAYERRLVALFRMIGSPGFERDEDDLRLLAAVSYERGVDQAGVLRQLVAILASGNRTADLRRITAATVVIHGTRDRMVSPSGGRATARAITGAKLVMVEGMGHDLPRGAWPQVVDAIVANAERAGAPAPVGAR